MRNIRHRKPKPQRTVYTINVNPTKTKQFSIRGRKKPRKARVALIKEFNGLVERGIVSNLKFNEHGFLAGADFSQELTPKETKLMRKVVLLTQEPYLRGQPPISKEKIVIGKITRFLREHERKGQFVFIHPTIETEIMEGKNAENVIRTAEMMNGANFGALRERIAGYDKTKVQRNLRRQLRYFESVLKVKKKKEMVIEVEKSQWDEAVTKIKLDGNNVIREMLVRVTPSHADIVFKAILKPNGQIVFETIEYEQSKNQNKRF